MPVYLYECQNCGIKTEKEQKMKDSPLKQCDSCGENTLERIISLTSFCLVGSGWAKDRYSSPYHKKE